MGKCVIQGYGVWVGRSQMEKIEVLEGKVNGIIWEILKGNKFGSLDGVCLGILQRLVNLEFCLFGVGVGLEGVLFGFLIMGWIYFEMNWILEEM